MMKIFGRSLLRRSGHSAEPEPCSTVSAVPASVPNAEVCAMSPARLLARSLTECATRHEWKRVDEPQMISAFGHSVRYENEVRNLWIVRSWWSSGLCGYGESLSSNFTLNEGEQKIVADALKAFNDREREDAEAAALARLIAPIEARSDETRSGSARRAKAGKSSE